MLINTLPRRALLLPYQILVIFCFLSLTLVYAVVGSIAGFISGSGNFVQRVLKQWAKISLAAAGLKVQIAGLEKLDLKSVYIFMPNHASFLDILLLLAYLPHEFRFIIKKETFAVPLVGRALRNSGHISMDRNNPWKALRSLRRSADLLKSGISVVVFPEGTRSHDGTIQEFKAALFILPIRRQTPVVPVLIEGAFEALKRGSILLYPVPLKITFHDPIPANSFTVRDRGAYAEQVRRALCMPPSRINSKNGWDIGVPLK